MSIGVAGSSSSGTTTYPVVIGIVGDGTDLRNGSVASVAIVTNANIGCARGADVGDHDARFPPHGPRARRWNGHNEDGRGSAAIGATWTEITSGLTAGEEVVLADMNEPLPGSATDSSGSTNQNQFRRPRRPHRLPGATAEVSVPAGYEPATICKRRRVMRAMRHAPASSA